MSENVVAVRSIEIVTAEITMIRDNARKSFWNRSSRSARGLRRPSRWCPLASGRLI